MNETIRSILDRRSIRAYEDKPLTEEQLTLLEQCAVASPTGMNAQSWSFSFVTDREKIAMVDSAVVAKLDNGTKQRVDSRGGTVFYNAPLVIFISGDKNSVWSEVDAGIAVENLALCAHSLGLGSVIIGMCRCAFEGEEGKRLGEMLRFPENNRISCFPENGTGRILKRYVL